MMKIKDHLLRWIDKAKPDYECEHCVGQSYGVGCYCQYHGAYAPCEPRGPWWFELLLKLEARLKGLK